MPFPPFFWKEKTFFWISRLQSSSYFSPQNWIHPVGFPVERKKTGFRLSNTHHATCSHMLLCMCECFGKNKYLIVNGRCVCRCVWLHVLTEKWKGRMYVCVYVCVCGMVGYNTRTHTDTVQNTTGSKWYMSTVRAIWWELIFTHVDTYTYMVT